MIIAIPVNEDRKTVCVSFGRTPEYLLVDIDNNDRQYIINEASSASGGAGIQAAQLLVDNSVDVLLTPRCGDNSAKVLNAARIEMYKTTSDNVEDELNKFQKGELNILTEIQAGFHAQGFN